jgi:hypothetical protein
MIAAARTIGTSWSMTAITDRRKVSNIRRQHHSRGTSNSSSNSQLEHTATAGETIGTSQTPTAEERPATAMMPEIVEPRG